MTKTPKSNAISRRSMLKGTAAVAGTAIGSGVVTGFPTIWAQNIKDVTLRQFGTGVSNLNDVANKVKEDLGFTLEMTALDSDSVTQRAATQPKSFDIADIEYWICKKVWPTGNLQAMDTIQDHELTTRLSPIFTHRQADAGKHRCSGHRTKHGRLCRWQGWHLVCQGCHRLDDPDPDHLQCRHAGHSPRPDWPSDRHLGRTAQP